jgi:hypothetical protein
MTEFAQGSTHTYTHWRRTHRDFSQHRTCAFFLLFNSLNSTDYIMSSHHFRKLVCVYVAQFAFQVRTCSCGIFFGRVTCSGEDQHMKDITNHHSWTVVNLSWAQIKTGPSVTPTSHLLQFNSKDI